MSVPTRRVELKVADGRCSVVFPAYKVLIESRLLSPLEGRTALLNFQLLKVFPR